GWRSSIGRHLRNEAVFSFGNTHHSRSITASADRPTIEIYVHNAIRMRAGIYILNAIPPNTYVRTVLVDPSARPKILDFVSTSLAAHWFCGNFDARRR